jgi:hypothetical protein
MVTPSYTGQNDIESIVTILDANQSMCRRVLTSMRSTQDGNHCDGGGRPTFTFDVLEERNGSDD